MADHPEGRKSPRARPYENLIPLPEIIADAKGVGASSKRVDQDFYKMLNKLGNELFILKEAPLEAVKKVAGSLAAEGIRRVRASEVKIAAGYDGEYGKINIFSQQERELPEEQMSLF